MGEDGEKEERKGVFHLVHGWIQQVQKKKVSQPLQNAISADLYGTGPLHVLPHDQEWECARSDQGLLLKYHAASKDVGGDV